MVTRVCSTYKGLTRAWNIASFPCERTLQRDGFTLPLRCMQMSNITRVPETKTCRQARQHLRVESEKRAGQIDNERQTMNTLETKNEYSITHRSPHDPPYTSHEVEVLGSALEKGTRIKSGWKQIPGKMRDGLRYKNLITSILF